MNDSKDNDDRTGDAEDTPGSDLTAAIRRERSFSVAEALAREAGGMLKGASPVPSARQLVLAAEAMLEARLTDSEGSLRRTLSARLAGDPPLLARHFGDPAGLLREFLTATLASAGLLEILVRQADARWGRDYDERPRFEHRDQPPAPDDPYTVSGVRAQLAELLASLSV